MKVVATSHSDSVEPIRTTLVATIGPASSSAEKLKALLDAGKRPATNAAFAMPGFCCVCARQRTDAVQRTALLTVHDASNACVRVGMTVARFNLAHGTREVQEKAITTLRETLAAERRVCAVLVSLRGAIMRTAGSSSSGVRRVREGDVLTWRCDAAAPDEPTTVRCPALPGALAEGDTLLIDDGQLSCKVLASDADTGRILTVATNDSFFGPAQRVECYDARFDDAYWSAVEAADVDDARWAAGLGAELIDAPPRSMAAVRAALADADVEFIERVENRATLAAALASTGGEARTAGTLLLRAQTGVHCGVAELTVAQRALTAHAVRIRRPLLVCAQLLGSMVRNPLPSRAEVTDVYNAVTSGAHALVLTAETAVGRAPARAVRQLGRICAEAESGIDYRAEYVALRRDATPGGSLAGSLASSAALVARDGDATLLLLVEPDRELSSHVALYRSCNVVQLFDAAQRHAAARATLLRGRGVLVVDKLAPPAQLHSDWASYVAVLKQAGTVRSGTKLVVCTQHTIELQVVDDNDSDNASAAAKIDGAK